MVCRPGHPASAGKLQHSGDAKPVPLGDSTWQMDCTMTQLSKKAWEKGYVLDMKSTTLPFGDAFATFLFP